MSGELFAVAGCKLYIGGVLAPKSTDFVEGDFSAVSWTEIDGWETMGPIGDTAALLTSSLINRGRDIKQKGTRNAGSMENVFASVDGDDGQAALLAAEKTSVNYAFKIVMNDTPTSGPTPTPSKRLFIGLVMSAQEVGGDANTIRKLKSTVEINSNIVVVAAATGA